MEQALDLVVDRAHGREGEHGCPVPFDHGERVLPRSVHRAGGEGLVATADGPDDERISGKDPPLRGRSLA